VGVEGERELREGGGGRRKRGGGRRRKEGGGGGGGRRRGDRVGVVTKMSQRVGMFIFVGVHL
jgi:hypothetical protein